ncbi:GcrA family cell cycle regulator [Algihabitans albus]|uniref:GcrA family cell cycle regulator n=1 Tax=Algihabitans albus TaxID=2164067 RepID=UPI000E5C7700|nr:GcrA family cell cycle regulator [Algihabitans albus]
MSWTPERIDELKRLWDAGHSASEIGKQLGVSKNAVVGKAHRLKLAARPSPIKRGGGTTRRRPAAAQRQAAARAATAGPFAGGAASAMAAAGGSTANGSAPSGKAVSASPFVAPEPERGPARARGRARPVRRSLGTQNCAWPIGDPGDPTFHFCGERAVAGKPYCETHCAQAYITRKKEEAA